MGQINNIDAAENVKILMGDGSVVVLANPETISISPHISDNMVDFTAYNCTVLPYDYYNDKLYIANEKLRTVHTLLRTLSFMLEQYSMPDDKNYVVPFESTQDMAKYFKLIADMCLKESEID